MDPIQPIGPRPPWIAELAAEHTQSLSRERRGAAGGNERKRGPRREPLRAQEGPDEDDPDGEGPEGRHIDVHA
jgi:hypothetical protein